MKYNKHFTKSGRFRDQMWDLMGNSIIFSPSDDSWNERRKHVSAAFYKEKMKRMINIAAGVAFERVQEWKRDYAGKDRDFFIYREPADLVNDCIQASVFGSSILDEKLEYIEKGVTKKLTIG